MTLTFLRACGATSLAIGLALAGSSNVSAQVQPTLARAIPPSAAPHALAAVIAAPRAVATAAPVQTPRRRPVRRATYGSPVLRTVQAGNDAARSTPSAGAYLNAALYYDFEPGRLYVVHTSPRFLTAITLRPGEKLVSKAAGDTVRWVLGETVQGAGAGQQVIVFVKPIRGGLRTNIILTTDQRTYLLEAVSHEGETYTSVISWNYPQEEMRDAQAARAAADQTVVASSIAIDRLNFSYRIQPIGARRGPRWQPLRVFDDGLKTYIQFPADLAATEAPPLFLIGPNRQAELVNYRFANGYYVVDRMIDVAELRLGEGRQVVVRISRTGGGR
ncbi:P-type conjugative transfer protein TrbG (plasmid) [Caulobacter sp. ErkDOM-YI]|uniref:P-type conjugative transfer protein TrbG n=1 Tax=unclassified Caulobacter TaxID=2648921 RepID=UPI003AF68B5A